MPVNNPSKRVDTLLQEFQRFWRKNSEIWEQKSDYTEAFPHIRRSKKRRPAPNKNVP
jgi:hypothetical protein